MSASNLKEKQKLMFNKGERLKQLIKKHPEIKAKILRRHSNRNLSQNETTNNNTAQVFSRRGII